MSPTERPAAGSGSKQVVEAEYEVKLGVFEGPLDLLLYLVQKNELNPREISIATITDQYLAYLETGPLAEGIRDMNLSNAGEFLVMAARLMRLKARELLPADQKDELEDMEYELDRQALIQQMLEYQKFKEAARVLRNFEGGQFGAFARGRAETGEERKDEELEEEAGVFDLLSAFRKVVLERPRPPVHEVEIDDVTIEDRMQEVEIALNERGRSLFEDLFPHDHRTIVLVVTFMSILELAKLDRIVFRQSHAMGPIWVYRKQKVSPYEMELKIDEGHQDPLPDFKPGLAELVREQAKERTAANALEAALRELEQEMLNPGAAAAAAAEKEKAAQTAAVEAAPIDPTSIDPSSDAAVATNPDAIEAGSIDGDDPETAVASVATVASVASVDQGDATAAPMDAIPTDALAPEDEAPLSPEADAALRDLLGRVREAPEPDLSVPDADEDQ